MINIKLLIYLFLLNQNYILMFSAFFVYAVKICLLLKINYENKHFFEIKMHLIFDTSF